VTAAAILAEAEAAGLRFRVGADGRLRITGEAPLEFVGWLWERRAELIAALQAGPVTVRNGQSSDEKPRR
jgi:hypothetical protein